MKLRLRSRVAYPPKDERKEPFERFCTERDSFIQKDRMMMHAAKAASVMKIDFHPHVSASKPPMTGDEAGAMPFIAPTSAMSAASL